MAKANPNLTQRQREIYEFVKGEINGGQMTPTVREIGDEFGIKSPNGVMCHLKALEKKGLITREPNLSRAIQLTDKSTVPTCQIRISEKTIGTGDIGRTLAGQRIDVIPALANAQGFVLTGPTDTTFTIAPGSVILARKNGIGCAYVNPKTGKIVSKVGPDTLAIIMIIAPGLLG